MRAWGTGPHACAHNKYNCTLTIQVVFLFASYQLPAAREDVSFHKRKIDIALYFTVLAQVREVYRPGKVVPLSTMVDTTVQLS